MQITEGIAPANANTNVRFRTTYYFRVFDYCYDAKAKRNLQPITDTLYRFKMTGKANPLANYIRFESGTLRDSQIDPFGATIERDKETGRLRFVPDSEVRAAANRSKAEQEFRGLLDLKRELLAMNALAAKPGDDPTPEHSLPVSQKTLAALDKQINSVVENRMAYGELPTSTTYDGKTLNEVCPSGSEIQRGFQLMGPQGVKTFKQDERLIMAMSGSAKPLISALQEVSGRMLKSEEATRSTADMLFPLVVERLRVSDMGLQLATQQDTSSSATKALIEGLAQRLREDRP